MAHDNSVEHIQATSQYKVLHDYVAGRVTLSDGHEKFCKAVEDKYMTSQKAEDVEALLWNCWGAVVEAAKAYAQDSSKRQRLVDFVLTLQRRPILQKDGAVCKVWDARVWADLPVFGAELREGWNAPQDSATEHDKHTWLNLNAFTANLVATAHEHHADRPDLSLYAIWTLRDAFEQEKPSTVAIEAAATWLICAAPTLSALSKRKKSFDGKLARSGPAYQAKDWRGFNNERWQTWISQLSQLDKKAYGSRAEDLLTKSTQKVQALE